MGRYRVNVECSQKLPQTKSEYFTHCSYEVQAISKGVAKAMVRGKSKRYMVSSEKEMSFMTELMRRQGEVQP